MCALELGTRLSDLAAERLCDSVEPFYHLAQKKYITSSC